ncbi:MAG TPA: PIN domain-containing protein [Pyrinomonadaceae bacterium]|nr:PIN domain-containing protein [Acidobacteriota bacterium]HQZ94908.1 PIN domain-containing protein [Pyrinomonadaceae bacterium]
MILPDVNLLLYAYDRGSKFHTAAVLWLEKTLLEDEVFFSWHTITGFLRIVTNPRILTNPATLDAAISIVDSWLTLENTHLVFLEKKNWPLFSKILLDAQANGNLVMDAHLAAMAAACGATLASTDRDFTRFSGIQFVDPIKS